MLCFGNAYDMTASQELFNGASLQAAVDHGFIVEWSHMI
jgi:hypothetical protein